MIVPSDPDYQETKLIKQGKASLNPDFKSLADWINIQWNVYVLNIHYDIPTGAYSKPFPRLNIIFENLEDQLQFQDGRLGNYHAFKQQTIAEKFDELVNGISKEQTRSFWSLFKKKQFKYDTKGLLVIFSSFKPVARDEANEGIPKAEIETYKTELNNPEIWEVSNFAAGATVFFYTEKQAETARQNGYIQQLKSMYFSILKKHDEFDYFNEESFSLSVNSKENFDLNYESNWYYYYK